MTSPRHESSLRHSAWLVDLDGTLYRPWPVKLAMAARLAVGGWGALPIIRTFRRQHEEIHHELAAHPELCFQPSPFAEQIRRTAHQLGLDEQVVSRIVQRWMIERPAPWLRLFRRRSLLEEIGAARVQGLRTALVSDYPARRKLEALGCLGLFDVIVSNGEHPGLRRLKPSPEGFLLAAEELGAQRAGMAFRRIG